MPTIQNEEPMWNLDVPQFELYLFHRFQGCEVFVMLIYLKYIAIDQQTTLPTKVDLQTPLHILYGQYSWSSWEEAELEPTLRYLRGCKGLRIPEEFRPLLPSIL